MSLIFNESNNFLEKYQKKKQPVYIVGTKGFIKCYISYLTVLKMNDIPVRAIITDEKKPDGAEGIEVKNFGALAEIKEKSYFLVSNAYPLRIKNSCIDAIKQADVDGEAFIQFPFAVKVPVLEDVLCFQDKEIFDKYYPSYRFMFEYNAAGLAGFDNDPYEYISGVFDHNGVKMYGDYYSMADFTSKYVNINNKERKTYYQIDDSLNDIYMLGSSITFGHFCEDRFTISSFLQKRLNDAGIRYNVHNMAVRGNFLLNIYYQILHLNLKRGDIVLICDLRHICKDGYSDEVQPDVVLWILEEIRCFVDSFGADLYVYINHSFKLNDSLFEKIINNDVGLKLTTGAVTKKNTVKFNGMKQYPCDLNRLYIKAQQRQIRLFMQSHVLKANQCNSNMYFDNHHYSMIGNDIISKVLFDILPIHKENSCERIIFESKLAFQRNLDSFLLTPQFVQELEMLKKERVDCNDCGAIVMNCNPFTNGHLHLVKYAASRVKHLYLFVVEENKSIFSFEDRFMLVKKNTEMLKNVTVLKSSKLVISSLTFPEYFTKSSIQDQEIDPSTDVYIFAKFICPALNINVRFVGDEPLDKITMQYNECMKRIFPEFAVRLDVIPRLESNDEPISASRVRKLLESKDINALEKLVPPATLEYLKTRIEI